MTKREALTMIKELVNANEELVAFCDHEIELLDKKANAKSSKPSPRQIENDYVKGRIMDVLTTEGQTVTELTNALNALEDVATTVKGVRLTVPRVTAILRQIDRTSVKNEIVKGKSLYSLA